MESGNYPHLAAYPLGPLLQQSDLVVARAPTFGWPRGLSRAEAALYIGVSPGTFDRLVSDGIMPKPRRVRTRVLWDRVEVDIAFDAFGEPSDTGKNDWD